MKKILTILGFMLLLWSISFAQENKLNQTIAEIQAILDSGGGGLDSATVETLIEAQTLLLQSSINQTYANKTSLQSIESKVDSIMNILLPSITDRVEALEEGIQILPTPVLQVPTNLVAVGDVGKIDLTWNASGIRDGFEVFGSKVELLSQPPYVYNVVGTTDSATTSYSHTGLGSGGGGNIFTVSNESGDLTQYTSTVDATNSNITVTQASRKNGSYGMQIDITGNISSINSYGTKTTSGNDIYGAFFLKTNIDSFTGTWSSGYFLELRDDDSSKSRLRFGIKSGGTTPIASLEYEMNLPNGVRRTNSTSTKLADLLAQDWLYVEYRYRVDNDSGGCQIWVDSTLLFNDMTHSTIGATVEQSRLGYPYGTTNSRPPTNAWIYFDSWTESSSRLTQWNEFSGKETWRYYVRSYKGDIYSGQSNIVLASTIANDTTIYTPPNDTTGSGGSSVIGQWFVVKGATGDGTGTSYGNAFPSFASINWSAMSDGDTLVIGTQLNADTTSYYEELTMGRGNITITRSTANGYNGVVVIDGQSIRNYGIHNGTSGRNNYTIDGLDKTKLIIKGFISQGIRFRYNNNGTARNFTVYLNEPNAFSGVFLYSNEWQLPPTFTGNYLIENFSILQDSGSYAGGGNSDGFQIGGVNNVTVRNGLIRLQNADNTPHQDLVQFYRCKNITVENIKGYSLNAGSTSNKQGIYITDSGGKIKIRNNYVYLGQNSFGSGIAIEQYDNTWWTTYLQPDSFIVTNNTVECAYDRPNAIRLVQSISSTNFSANAILKNNIFIEGTFAIDKKYFTSVNNCNYNNYYEVGGDVTIYDQPTNSTGTARTWAVWQGYGYDANSYITNPNLSGYIPNTSGDADGNGTDPSPYGYINDIDGITRTSPYWIGCAEGDE